MNSGAQGGTLTGIVVCDTERRRRRLSVLRAYILLPALATSVAQAAATPTPVGLTIQVTLALSGLHPAVTQAGLDCGAIAQTAAWVEARRGTLVDYDSVNQVVLRPAHYLGQESLISVPIAGRRYAGSTSIRLSLPQGLSDPVTHGPWTPTPTVLVACWLTLNGRPATWDRGSTPQAVTPSNFVGVTPNPVVVAVVDASGAGPLAATGHLSAQGQYFVPASVSVAATVQLSGSASAPLAGVPGLPGAAVNTPRAPNAPAPSASSSTGGSTRVPASITLSGTLMAARSTQTPLKLTLASALSAAGGARLPGSLLLSAVLTASGGARLPTPITLTAALAAKGGTRVPAPITLSAALTASGAVRPARPPRTQSSMSLPK